MFTFTMDLEDGNIPVLKTVLMIYKVSAQENVYTIVIKIRR